MTKIHGYNELPTIVIPLWWVFLLQFWGTMPIMLEVACIVSLAIHDYADFGIIFCMLLCNGCLGFYEELKAAKSLAELTSKMEQHIPTIRDGVAEGLLTRLLVPGDIVLLCGGCAVPADIEWIEGDILQVNTAALTGEPLPRKYPSDDHGGLILCGCTIQAGEAYGIVRKTGVNTEIGQANSEIMKDKTETKISVFERKVLLTVQVIIVASLFIVIIIFIEQGTKNGEFNSKETVRDLLLTCLSIIIAAVPIALPLVLQVTMALGAGKMATDFSAVVTSLPALQDISSMACLCSDKTGTLTTAKISIHAESVWVAGDFSKEDLALYGGLSSNRDKKEDPIDRSVINHFDRIFGPSGIEKCSEYVKTRSVGFNPIYKRVVWEYNHPKLGKVTIAKGLPTKVADTAEGNKDDAEDQWKVENYDKLIQEIKTKDLAFSKAGYKTLGVVVKIGNGPYKYVGILPMLDPPRHDSAATVKNLQNAGINVKMITGDHLNIAKETARLIGMGVNMYPGSVTREPGQDTYDTILNADGFASVLPKDKREVVLVLRNQFHMVVGMTGDGVNDAPALSAAQCGVAVDDATDAAKNAAAIILTSPGLSAIYSGVVESRRIFRKLKAYVTYRFGATIQLVSVLTILILGVECIINPFYVILLALFNDITMLPIAYDYQAASSLPEQPDVGKLLTVSFALGFMETAFTLIFALGIISDDNIFSGSYSAHILYQDDDNTVSQCDKPSQALIWLQMFIAAELLIFSARAPYYFWLSYLPSYPLFVSVMGGNIVASIIANLSKDFGNIPASDIVIVWCYNIFTLIAIDVLKVYIYKIQGENMDTLPDNDPFLVDKAASHDVENVEDINDSRVGAQSDRLTLLVGNDRLSKAQVQSARASHAQYNKNHSKQSITNAVRINSIAGASDATGGLRASIVSQQKNLRPNEPSNLLVGKKR